MFSYDSVAIILSLGLFLADSQSYKVARFSCLTMVDNGIKVCYNGIVD